MSRLNINKKYLDSKWTTGEVSEELKRGIALLNNVDNKIISVFGSHMVTAKNRYFQGCRKLAFDLGKEGYAIVTGGGPGIMQAANTGAYEAKSPSIGMTAQLIKGEKVVQHIFTHKIGFKFMFVRRFLMSIKSEALIFYPGGYGTLNELFEFVVLMQTNLVDPVPIICVDRKYWKGLFKWVEGHISKENFLINRKRDLGLITLVDTQQEIMDIIGNH